MFTEFDGYRGLFSFQSSLMFSLDLRFGCLESWMNGSAETSLSYGTILVVQCCLLTFSHLGRHLWSLRAHFGGPWLTMDALWVTLVVLWVMWGAPESDLECRGVSWGLFQSPLGDPWAHFGDAWAHFRKPWAPKTH